MTGKSYGIQSPQFQAMDPDRLQTGLAQIAYGNNPIAAGLALSGENIAHEMRTNQYLDQLRQSNALAATLAQQGMQNDYNISELGNLANIAEKTGQVINMPRSGIIGTTPQQGMQANIDNSLNRSLQNPKVLSEILKNIAPARNEAGLDSSALRSIVGAAPFQDTQSVMQARTGMAMADATAQTNKQTVGTSLDFSTSPQTWTDAERALLPAYYRGDKAAEETLMKLGKFKITKTGSDSVSQKGPRTGDISKGTTAAPAVAKHPPKIQALMNQGVIIGHKNGVYRNEKTGEIISPN